MNEYRGPIDLHLAYRPPGVEGQLSHTHIAAWVTYVAERGAWSLLVEEPVNVLSRAGLIHAEVVFPDGQRLVGDVHRISELGNAFDLIPETYV